MVLADIVELERGAAERNVAFVADNLVRNHHIRRLERIYAGFGITVCDEDRPGILERLATCDVVEMAVAVNHIFDRSLGDLLDLLDVCLRGWTSQADRIGCDHALRGDDEHRLMPAEAEDVDILRALHLGGGVGGSRCLGGRSPGEGDRYRDPRKNCGCSWRSGSSRARHRTLP